MLEKKLKYALVPVLALVLAACGGRDIPAGSVPVPPAREPRTEIIPPEEARRLAQTLSARNQGLSSWNDLAFAVRQSLEYTRLRPPAEAPPTHGPARLSRDGLRQGLERLLDILPYLDVNPGLLADEFRWLRLAPDFGFTGYYEPTLRADYKPGPIYRHPIYALPPDLKKGAPYHDRNAIDRRGVLKGRGLELAWAADDVDVFFLHVQGSGRLVYPDGKVRHVLYAGKNNRSYVSLGRVLREEGLLAPDKVSMPGIRKYLADNPGRKAELLDRNPSYVFFRLADDGPLGSMGRGLTPRVSLAVDPGVLPYGSLLFFNVGLPDDSGANNRNTRALGLPQDSGGAIKGRRIDLFMGAGAEAEHVAGHLNSEGAVYILLPAANGSFTREISTGEWPPAAARTRPD